MVTLTKAPDKPRTPLSTAPIMKTPDTHPPVYILSSTRKLGYLQIIIALLTLIMQKKSFEVDFVPGILCGITLLLAGLLAVGPGSQSASKMIISTMVMSCPVSVVFMCLYRISVFLETPYITGRLQCHDYYCEVNGKSETALSIVMILAVILSVMSIWQSLISCAVLCRLPFMKTAIAQRENKVMISESSLEGIINKSDIASTSL